MSVDQLHRWLEDDLQREFDRLDTNQDGYVSRQEFCAVYGTGAQREFERADVNKDSNLSREEFIDWFSGSLRPPAMQRWIETTPAWARLTLAGALAGTITKTSTAPLDRVKVLLQVQSVNPDVSGKYQGVVGATTRVIRDEGLPALWKGNGANCVRVVPVYAARFAFNDMLKEAVREPGQSRKEMRLSQLALAGTGAGLIQQVICYPLETVRTRLSMGKAFGAQYKVYVLTWLSELD